MSERENIPIALLIGQGSRVWPLFRRIEEEKSNLQVTSVVSHKAVSSPRPFLPSEKPLGMDIADRLGIPVYPWNYVQIRNLKKEFDPNFTDHRFRKDYSEWLALLICQKYPVRPKGVVMLGWDIILTEDFWQYFPGPAKEVYNGINLHPAPMSSGETYRFADGYEVPVFKGEHDDVIKRVLSADLKRYGSSMHFVTSGVDEGPVIKVADFEITEAEKTEKGYEKKLQEVEEHLVEEVVEDFGAGRFTVENGEVKRV
jgi:folate-dependent phosphoribosylglycinamide formyltransferase PurN